MFRANQCFKFYSAPLDCALGGADAGADDRCFIVLNMLLCFMLYAFHVFSELWNLVPSRRKVVFQKSEAGNIFYC